MVLGKPFAWAPLRSDDFCRCGTSRRAWYCQSCAALSWPNRTRAAVRRSVPRRNGLACAGARYDKQPQRRSDRAGFYSCGGSGSRDRSIGISRHSGSDALSASGSRSRAHDTLRSRSRTCAGILPAAPTPRSRRSAPSRRSFLRAACSQCSNHFLDHPIAAGTRAAIRAPVLEARTQRPAAQAAPIFGTAHDRGPGASRSFDKARASAEPSSFGATRSLFLRDRVGPADS